MSDPTPSPAGTCIYCAEPLPTAVERCPACGESTKPRAADLGPPRPLGPKILALFNLLFGGMGLIGVVGVVLMFAFMPADPRDPTRAAMAREPVFAVWTYLTQGLGALAAIGQLVSAVGLLGWREWGRRLAVQVAAFQLFQLVAGSLMMFVYVALPAMTGAVPSDPAMQAIAVGGAFGGVCFGAILPVATLLVLRRPATREAFAQAEKERPAA